MKQFRPTVVILLTIWLTAAPSHAFLDFKTEISSNDSLHLVAPIPSGGSLHLLMHPSKTLGLVTGDRRSVRILHRIVGSKSDVTVRFRSSRPDIVRVVGNTSLLTLSPDDNSDWLVGNSTIMTGVNSTELNSSRAAVSLEGVFLGRALIQVFIKNGTNAKGTPIWSLFDNAYQVSVIRPFRSIDRIFTGVVIILVFFANLGIGTELKLKVVKKVLKKPIPPLIGFCCQYTIMPVVAFGVGTLLKLPPSILLGYFASGCAPGGGSSNFYSYLLGGDVSLSITMTLISTLAALGMVPLWLFTLGRYILQNQPYEVKIPFQNIMISLISMLIPIAIGYLIKRKLPKVAKVINKMIKPFIIIMILFFLTFGIYANLYIFKLFSPLLIAAGCLLPYCGFVLGGLVAFIARLRFRFVKTIAIETGIQNTGLPIFLLKVSLPQPDSDISIVGPVANSMFTPIPLYISIIIREIYRRRCKKPKGDEADENSDDEIEMNGSVKQSDDMDEKQEKSSPKEHVDDTSDSDNKNEKQPFLDENKESI